PASRSTLLPYTTLFRSIRQPFRGWAAGWRLCGDHPGSTEVREDPMSSFILAIDQGTTSTRAIVFDDNYQVRGVGQQEFPQHFPRDRKSTRLNSSHVKIS